MGPLRGVLRLQRIVVPRTVGEGEGQGSIRMAVHRRRRGGYPPPPWTPPPGPKQPSMEKTKLQLEKSVWAIFGTQNFGAQTPPPLLILPGEEEAPRFETGASHPPLRVQVTVEVGRRSPGWGGGGGGGGIYMPRMIAMSTQPEAEGRRNMILGVAPMLDPGWAPAVVDPGWHLPAPS